MSLILQSEKIGDVVVIRCRGRIVMGDEAGSLQLELERRAQETKNIVLQLAEINFIDSSGLGALVRHFGILRNAQGDLKLCQLSPSLIRVLQATNLLSVFHTYASEKEAIDAFSDRSRSPEETSGTAATRIVCVDTSTDLLAYLNALLKRSGYEVFTTRYPSDARILVTSTKPSIVIIGPGMRTNEALIEKFRQTDPSVHFLSLESDFSTAEASQAGVNLVNRIRWLLKVQQ
jgi:anti-sigma B factor antagonist